MNDITQSAPMMLRRAQQRRMTWPGLTTVAFTALIVAVILGVW